MVSKASDDLPEPLTPVKMTSFPCGNVTSTFLRLWVRAPRTTSGPRAGVEALGTVFTCLYVANFGEAVSQQSYYRDSAAARQTLQGRVISGPRQWRSAIATTFRSATSDSYACRRPSESGARSTADGWIVATTRGRRPGSE